VIAPSNTSLRTDSLRLASPAATSGRAQALGGNESDDFRSAKTGDFAWARTAM
jgi:hypothetical protein